MLYKIELDIKLNFIQFYRGSCTTRLLLSLHASMMASMKVHTAGDHLTTIDINLCLVFQLYKDEKPSVLPSVGTFFATHIAPWFRLGSTPAGFAQNEAPVFVNHEVHFKRF